MFTDDQVTPVRLAVLIDLLRGYRQGVAREDLYRFLQPESLVPEGAKFGPAKATLNAGVELELVKVEDGKASLTAHCRQEKDAVTAILKAIDARVLGTKDVEKYFALFYSYYLGLGKQVYQRSYQNKQLWVEQFNRAVFGDDQQGNPFNPTKFDGLHRWFSFAGLGWYDPSDCFQANPYNRLERALPSIFRRRKALDYEEFMSEMATACPELDGGTLFLEANPNHSFAEKKCTLGFSHALVELHLDGIIALDCPADGKGWSIEEAEPPRGTFLGTRFNAVRLVAKD